ncbi:BamA/TamA family outer membrane protein [Pseudotamlana agarivorans]|uniref:BamA/TamA family outer membrane protein n=1 Tax=Pseudotamlana agarivorans TaxID=481183 RepID=UPI00083520B6|nr:BamA/TamA family outer membrane protein [Tamlana agarivorans]
MKKHILLLLLICTNTIIAQHDSIPKTKETDSTKPESKFDKFNKKAEAFFKKFPVPIYSHNPEAGNIYGFTKFNLLALSKKDTISKPSKLSEVFTLSSKGRINASISTELIFKENDRVVIAYINYQKQPDYIFGIGNDVKREDVEEIQLERIKFFATYMFRFNKYYYVGVPINFSSYYHIETEPDSFLIQDNVTGLDGGVSLGTGLAFSYDSRDNRYNPQEGAYIMTYIITNPKFLGSTYQFSRYEIDARKYFNPWLNHIVAIQATTSNTPGNTPFYELSMLGSDSQMRGYFRGAYRDHVLVDSQVEYRAPIWNIFGAAAWIGTGRVASGYEELSLDGWKLSYGAGLRIKVDSKNNTNLRIDFGFGPHNISGIYFGFAEAF